MTPNKGLVRKAIGSGPSGRSPRRASLFGPPSDSKHRSTSSRWKRKPSQPWPNNDLDQLRSNRLLFVHPFPTPAACAPKPVVGECDTVQGPTPQVRFWIVVVPRVKTASNPSMARRNLCRTTVDHRHCTVMNQQRTAALAAIKPGDSRRTLQMASSTALPTKSTGI